MFLCWSNLFVQHTHGLDLYDFHARQYDPATGLFTSMDPLCEKYYHISPYAYCAGNPVNAVGPDGKDWYIPNQGEISWTDYNSQEEMNKNGYAGKIYDRNTGKLKSAISTGCLLIVPSRYDKNGKPSNNGWDQFNDKLRGVKSFKMLLHRE